MPEGSPDLDVGVWKMKKEQKAKLIKGLKIFGPIVAGFFAILTIFIWLLGAENPETQAGYVGYLTRDALFGKTVYVGLQTGPTSYGRAWLMKVVNISVTPTKITEAFGQGAEVLSKDALKVTFQVHVLFRVKPDAIKELVEKYSTLNESATGKKDDKRPDVTEVAFENFIREPLRTAARQEVESLNAMEVGPSLTAISDKLTKWAQGYTANTPFQVMTVVAGNVQYPKIVTDAVENKLKVTQDLQAAATEVEIEKKKAERRIVEAQGIATATQIIQQKLTPLYIQHEAIEAQKMMANGSNHSVVYIPVGKSGVPLVSVVPDRVE